MCFNVLLITPVAFSVFVPACPRVAPNDMSNVVPIYEHFVGGWNATGCTSYEELPENAKKFVEFIEAYVNVPIKFIGVGPSEDETIRC